MNNELMPLQEFVNLIVHNTKIKICIDCLSDILSLDSMELEYNNTIHYNEVCNYAKTTRKGLRLCLKCKGLTTQKAVSLNRPFFGVCPWGVTEYIVPVIQNSNILCIVYVGNICADSEITKNCMNRAANITGVNKNITDKISSMDNAKTRELYESIGEAIKSYILLMYSKSKKKPEKKIHWVVRAFLSYADTFYNTDIKIEDISGLYNTNAKYAGRLFKKEVGMSFCEYLNNRRIEEAKRILIEKNMSIGEVAFECGYNNITYFNRVFKNITGLSPGEYRKSNINYRYITGV